MKKYLKPEIYEELLQQENIAVGEEESGNEGVVDGDMWLSKLTL